MSDDDLSCYFCFFWKPITPFTSGIQIQLQTEYYMKWISWAQPSPPPQGSRLVSSNLTRYNLVQLTVCLGAIEGGDKATGMQFPCPNHRGCYWVSVGVFGSLPSVVGERKHMDFKWECVRRVNNVFSEKNNLQYNSDLFNTCMYTGISSTFGIYWVEASRNVFERQTF